MDRDKFLVLTSDPEAITGVAVNVPTAEPRHKRFIFSKVKSVNSLCIHVFCITHIEIVTN